MQFFPVEINTAPPEMLVRVPGIGFLGANKIVAARRFSKLDFKDLFRMRIVMKRAVHFITCGGKFIGSRNEYALAGLLAARESYGDAEQLSIFKEETALSALTGEL